jgi:hypothetical protein
MISLLTNNQIGNHNLLTLLTAILALRVSSSVLLDRELLFLIPGRLFLLVDGEPLMVTPGRAFLVAGEEFPTFTFKATILICLTVGC